MKYISKKNMAIFLIMITIIQGFLVVSASNLFEVKCTIDDINKAEISIEVYDITELDETLISKDAKDIFKHLQDNNIKPSISGYFNENGSFTIEGLENRLLLIKAGSFYKNNILYESIPQKIDSSKIGSLEIVETKYEFEIPKDSSVTYTVKKEWYGEENKSHQEISISIIHDGVVYDTVYLSDKNNWTYQWTGADDKDWSVKENAVPEGYTVAYSQDGAVFKITNVADDKYYSYIEDNDVPNNNKTTTTTTTESKPTNIIESIYKYIKDDLVPKAFRPQTGLGSVLENMGGRMIVVILCILVSSGSLIIGRKINKQKRRQNI